MLVAEALRSFFIRMDFVRDKKIPICRAVDKQRADGKQTVSPQNLSHKKQRKKALKIAFQSQNDASVHDETNQKLKLKPDSIRDA